MHRFIILAIAVFPLLSACQAAPPPASDEASSKSMTGATDDASRPYELWGKPVPADHLRLVFQHWVEGGNEGAVVYGDGTVVWNSRSQHQVDHATVQALLDAYQEADFRAMEELYGQGPGIRARALVSLRAGDYYKVVVREMQGGVDDPVRPLVDRLVDILKPLEGGRGADSLADGLEKIMAGELSPKTLTLVAHYLPASGDGWLLRTVDGQADWRALSPTGAMGEPRLLRVPPAWFRKVAAAVQQAEAASLPGNITTDGAKVQLALQVLNHRHSVVARDFSRSDPAEDRAAWRRLETLLDELAELHAATVPESTE